MKLKTLALATLIIFAIKIKSQNNYDFNSYKYRVNLYKSKSFYLNSSSTNFLQGAADKNVGSTNWEKDLSQSNTSNTIAGGFDFYKFINTEKKQNVIMVGSNLNLSHSSSQYFDDGKRTNYSVYSYLNSFNYLSMLTRNYRNNSFNMNQITANLGVNANSSLNRTANNTKNGGIMPSIGFQYGLGKGRLELISDPVFATFWLEDMKIKGVVDQYSAEDVEALAKTITQIRNTRIIDFRFRTIDQIKMYDSFFMAQGLISKTDATYYTTLYDHYLYANNFTRYSGKRHTWYALGNSNFNFNSEITKNTIQKQNIRSSNIDLQAGLGFLFENEKALSLHRQKVNRSNVEIAFNNSNNHFRNEITDTTVRLIENNVARNNMYVNFNQFFGRGHYFNTRSYIECGTYLSLILNLRNTSFDIAPQFAFNLNYYYWFSPNLQLSTQCSVNAQNTLNIYEFSTNGSAQINGNIQPRFNLTLNYTIF